MRKTIRELEENAKNAARAQAAKRAKLEKKHAEQFNRCRCMSFVSKPQTECDYCVLAKYGLSKHITYDSLDHLCMKELLPFDEVVAALRKAESK
jgi:hypothetical protein